LTQWCEVFAFEPAPSVGQLCRKGSLSYHTCLNKFGITDGQIAI